MMSGLSSEILSIMFWFVLNGIAYPSSDTALSKSEGESSFT